MKRVVSISIGSSRRNHRVETNILGQDIIIERIGTDGDKKKAIQLIKDMDGKVDAFGLGGIDIYLRCKDKRYIIKDSIPLKQAASKTPILDGTFLKDTLERRIIRLINREDIVSLKNKKVLITSALDRYGMANAFEEHGSCIIYGDIIFALGIPLEIKSYNTLYNIARIIAPLILKLPFHMLYPTGKSQDAVPNNKFNRFFQEADIIAGDYLYIKKYMPETMEGKIIITNTITSSDIEDLAKRGVKLLVTTTPEFNGRSFGTNVIEAAIVALSGRNPENMESKDFEKLLDELEFRPRIEYLSGRNNTSSSNNIILEGDRRVSG
ncbi:quinate 5-dehydrogenase [Proteiniborus sp. MB09-C3]|uniref:quinate 5-dehydrogenase n=1 Tax=Proteiniborus sp. MB09-C3 TaxID=3050072 RepID=UPI002556436F|nr:quinate 5-dehydrogenase [Proteiniborus sp. MB09-C3]WIV13077.1 quinate 5-dehydrogenase [Proteiniborus sp. MB09-C3]